MAGFASFDDFQALDRVTGLTLSPDGSRLVAVIDSLSADGARRVPALWEIDPAGSTSARRLTRSEKGETRPAFYRDGSLLFVSGRDADDDDPPALWALPPIGEARRVLERAGGVDAVVTARDADRFAIGSAVLPGAADADADSQRRTARRDLKVQAILHRASPVRYWDHDLGPDERHLLAVAGTDTEPDTDTDPDTDPDTARGAVADLTPAPGRALDEASFVLTPDGSTVVTSWFRPEPGLPLASLVAIDVATGSRRTLAQAEQTSFTDPAVSRDGTLVAVVRERIGTYDDIPCFDLCVVDLASGELREVVTGGELWPGSPCFSATGDAVFFTADELGDAPVFRVDLADATVSRLTASGHFSQLQVAPDGRTLYALRDAVDCPPRVVRIDAHAVDQQAVELPAPGATGAGGRLERFTVTVADGTTVHARIALPDGASADAPVPLLLWAHGGPLGSWNGWSWRWNPWLLTARGYAVLLPDPAFSTGYGPGMVQRGWGEWGAAPYDDLMAVTDAALAREDVDASRTAMMGGSYGGYMANWIAGHTDRFRAIVTHASLWNIDSFWATTDDPGYWAYEWGAPLERPDRYERFSPHRFLDAITTPMLVIHGDKDYRVPIGEGLALWWDLQRRGVESAYLYFPDEGHWVLKPGNARVWYETVWAWLAQHLDGEPWVQPSLL